MKEYQLVGREIICYPESRVYTIVDLAGWKMDHFIPVIYWVDDAASVTTTFATKERGHVWDFV